ncbi:MAG: hypothetical protein AAF657_24030, partial [Acidobacteriota bacterium]
LSLPSPRYVCLLAWDARDVPADAIACFARKLLDSGAVYVCTWGPDCERVHDIVDEEDVDLDLPEHLDGVVMTTWHSDKPLADAIFFALLCSAPDEVYSAGCDSTIGISIGSAAWAEEIRAAFENPQAFLADLP